MSADTLLHLNFPGDLLAGRQPQITSKKNHIQELTAIYKQDFFSII